MTTDQLKNIFGRFQNLNLLLLIEDLRRGMVARGNWHDLENGNLCPIAHGWRCDRFRSDNYTTPWLWAGISDEEFYSTPNHFPYEWDNGLVTRDQLLSTLESIYAERLADADVVQAVCLPIGEPVDVPQAQAVAQ